MEGVAGNLNSFLFPRSKYQLKLLYDPCSLSGDNKMILRLLPGPSFIPESQENTDTIIAGIFTVKLFENKRQT